MSEPQPISSKPIWLGFHAVRGGVGTGGNLYCSRVFGAVVIGGGYQSGMGPYLPRVRRKCPPLMGLYPPRTALWSSNVSAISQRYWGFPHRAGRCRPEKAGFSRLVEVLEILNDLWTGDGTLSSRGGAGSTYEPSQSEIGRWGWDFHTVRECINPDDIRFRPRVVGVVDVWMDSDSGM